MPPATAYTFIRKIYGFQYVLVLKKRTHRALFTVQSASADGRHIAEAVYVKKRGVIGAFPCLPAAVP